MTEVIFVNKKRSGPIFPGDKEVMISSAGSKEKDIYKMMAVRIRDFRKQKGLTLKQLAQEADITPTFLGNIERGISKPTLYTAEKIARALELDFEELFIKYVPNPIRERYIINTKEKELKNKIQALLKNRPHKDLKIIYKIIMVIFEKQSHSIGH